MPRTVLYPLEERLADDLAMTGGTMPITVVVGSYEDCCAARRWLKGRPYAELLTVVTVEEVEAEMAAFRAAMVPKPRPKRVVL